MNVLVEVPRTRLRTLGPTGTLMEGNVEVFNDGVFLGGSKPFHEIPNWITSVLLNRHQGVCRVQESSKVRKRARL